MATIRITGLTTLQANALAMLFEESDEFIDFINEKMNSAADRIGTPYVEYDSVNTFAVEHEVNFD